MSALAALLLVGFSVGLSNFAGAVGIGLSGIDLRIRLRVGLAFGFFEALMPLLGLLLGRSLAAPLGHAGRFTGAGLLVLTGAYAIWQGMRVGTRTSGLRGGTSNRTLLVTALALSIDNLIVGFALATIGVNVLLAAAVMAAVSVAMSLAGLELGNQLGERIEAWSEVAGGVVLVLVGVALALQLL
jgi:manganese efflux pump family protein